MSTPIGQKILELRKKEKLSQQDLADLIGVSKGTIYTWETGKNRPSREFNRLLEHPRFKSYAAWLVSDEDSVQETPAHHMADRFDQLSRREQRDVLQYMEFLIQKRGGSSD